MKLSVALFFAGFFAALGAVFFLLSFGTDYWLLASETCHPDAGGGTGPGGVPLERGDFVVTQHELMDSTTFYHEGFFWRCSFGGKLEDDTMWKFWFTNQPPSKVCMHAYLFPFPVSEQTHNATSYDSAIIYRGFWSIFMLVGLVAVVLGGFIIICAAPFASHRLYKAGGSLFIAAGLFLLAVVVMFVIWVQVLDVVNEYVTHRVSVCPDFHLNIRYGLSFMFAPVGVFFSLLAGLLFLLIGRSLQLQFS
ncbi:transmembrane protein 182 isoform X1 [Conger conger]|uniref:transmembrane protein 182 isoform X1 n=1 Tax=Conger conger TaxID=82655 RepID=UPI002A5A1AF6|nr:transmembrane protein 182 isoform X1 [Conger conger]